jgi:hypothetical protein
MITGREFAASAPWLAASPLSLTGCSREPAANGHEAVAERNWRLGAVTGLRAMRLRPEGCKAYFSGKVQRLRYEFLP